MFENFRERLLTVQQDLATGLKTLSDKSRDAAVKKKERGIEHLPKFSAGVELLNRYEDTWANLHRQAMECAKAGEVVDGEVIMLSAYWEKKRNALSQLHEQLQHIPAFVVDLKCITSRLAQLEADFEELDGHLNHLEDLCRQCELQRLKHMQSLQLESYKMKKRKALEAIKVELDADHAHKVLDMEHAQQMKLRERQKFFEEAFQHDMEHYLSTGYLQIAERREPIGSMSSMEVNVDVLEQMDLMDMSDQEALDVFLNSGGEENSVTSPTLGPEPDACPNEITLKVPSQSDLRQKFCSLSSTCTDSVSQDVSEEGGDSPVVQSDEEVVQVDNILGTLNADAKENSDGSD